MRNYKWLHISEVEYWEPLARQLNVSRVARSKSGFLTAYKKANGDWRKLSDNWINKRNAFIARHMAQVNKRDENLYDSKGNPTRRHLSLIMWAYSPSPNRLKYEICSLIYCL